MEGHWACTVQPPTCLCLGCKLGAVARAQATPRRLSPSGSSSVLTTCHLQSCRMHSVTGSLHPGVAAEGVHDAEHDRGRVLTGPLGDSSAHLALEAAAWEHSPEPGIPWLLSLKSRTRVVT